MLDVFYCDFLYIEDFEVSRRIVKIFSLKNINVISVVYFKHFLEILNNFQNHPRTLFFTYFEARGLVWNIRTNYKANAIWFQNTISHALKMLLKEALIHIWVVRAI